MERDREVTLRFTAEPTDSNIFGNVHGGYVMRWIDQAAYACSVGWCGCDCVTVYVGGIRFYKPVHIGNLVEVSAKLIYTGNTSMHIAVDVCARELKSGVTTKTTHCISIFVALDDEGKPTSVPHWEPQTAEDIAMERYAKKLMDLRKDVEDEMSRYMAVC
jgi:acyl-CoA hydrolase